MKYFFLLFISIIFTACATQKSSYVSSGLRYDVITFSHAEHGLIKSDDPRYIAELHRCRSKVYGEGIDVNGVKINDHEELSGIFSRYIESKQKKEVKSYRGIPSDRQIDAMLTETTDLLNKVNSEDPEYINDIRRAREDAASCMEASFKVVRFDTYHKETGELLNTVEF